MEKVKDNYIVVIYFYALYSSKRCRKTVDKAQETYRNLSSKTRRLAAVKEQILIRFLGVGWEKAYQP